MVSGRLVEKKGQYVAILNLKHPDGKRLQKSIRLGLPAKGNKKAAAERLWELRMEYTQFQIVQNNFHNRSSVLFNDFAARWLQIKNEIVSPTTYKNYSHMVNKYMASYFSRLLLQEITYDHIEEYYQHLADCGLCSTTRQHHHAIFKQMFKLAFKEDLILKDPMMFVKKPKRRKPVIRYYSLSEAECLKKAVAGHKLELIVNLALFYGFRRSEVLGLKWYDIDFAARTILINRAVVEATVDGKRTIIEKRELKCEASRRTMPLSESMLALLAREYGNKKRHGSEYICTDKKGRLIKPDEVTNAFSKLLKANHLRPIRFHDLRHPNVKIPLKIFKCH